MIHSFSKDAMRATVHVQMMEPKLFSRPAHRRERFPGKNSELHTRTAAARMIREVVPIMKVRKTTPALWLLR